MTSPKIKIFPGETLYSALIRFHLITGCHPNQILLSCLGKKKTRIHPYLPSNLQKFSDFLGVDVDFILVNHTLFPIFSCFQNEIYAQKLRSVMITGTSQLVMHTSLISSTQYKFPFAHKYCSICAKNDMEKLGVSYYHIMHQIPGVVYCAEHMCPLEYYELRLSGSPEFCFLPLPKPTQNYDLSDVNRRISFFSKSLLDVVRFRCNFNIKNAYSVKLRVLGLITNNAQIKMSKLIDYLHLLHPELNASISIGDLFIKLESKFLYQLISENYAYPQHPFKHIFLSSLLFDSIDDLLECSDSLNKKESVVRVKRKILKKQKIINSKASHDILRMAEEGVHRFDIAKKLSVSVGYVEQIISSDPVLVQKRKEIKKVFIRDKHRKVIINYVDAHSDCKRKDIKEKCSKSFYWCYLYDKPWLETILPPPNKPIPGKKVNWAERDRKLSLQISDVISNLKVPLSLSALDRAIGGHGWLIKYRKNFPKTMKIINQAIHEKS